ncbi:hypothetical protein EHE19_008410 [Ruminiclostridium herbifermentans]|uniref:Uncharacterized protein n=1 Tax=Ruminiclostridium herbifermentans TaxID=2488810 RepID=A0A4U7JJE9_9FIRM|nr:hypothetical protein [Ruminiclostridium herbifermentans]QNU68810.1 hypothetical protein EHE19_008410 [Ruminiclostridium herbifermentans]
METIMKIPFLLAILASIITGAISIVNNAGTNKTCVRMIFAMIIFYIIGLLVSKTIISIVEEQNKQKLEAEKKKEEEEMFEKAKASAKVKKPEHLGNTLDLSTEEEIDDGFTPFDLSQAVKTKMKE